MWRAVRKVLDDNQAIWSNNAPFSSYSTALTDAIIAADAALLRQQATSVGASQDKKSLERLAVNKTAAIADCASAYALDQNNHTLLVIVNISKSAMLLLPQNELVQKLNHILDAADPLVKELQSYGITKDDLSEARTAVNSFQLAEVHPRTIIAERKAITASVPVIMQNGRLALGKMDLLIDTFSEDHPEFVSQFKEARLVVDSGTRHRNPEDHPDK
jgi:hypothetical protein